MKVKDLIASQAVVTMRLDEPLSHAAELMVRHGVSGVPVVDAWGVLAGLVTASDLLRLAVQGHAAAPDLPQDPTWSPAARRLDHDPGWMDRTAQDTMVTDLCTVDLDSDVQQAARAMINRGVHRAVVLGKDRNVAGVVSALDMTLLVAEAERLDLPGRK